MNIILIGHTGFIGKSIYNKLNLNFKLIGLSSSVVDLTLSEASSKLAKYYTDDSIVIMCAGVKKQLGDSFTTYISNLSILNNFCNSLSLKSPKRVIYFSSLAVYGEDSEYLNKIDEDISPQPKSYYGIIKYLGEKIINKVCNENNIELLILRPPLVYGKDDFSRGYGPTGFYYKAIKNKKIELWGNGSEYREFIYVEDIGKIVSILIKNNQLGLFNLVSGLSYTFQDVIESLKLVLNKTSLKIKINKRTMKKVDNFFSNKLIVSALDNFNFTSLSEGINKMNKKYKETQLG